MNRRTELKLGSAPAPGAVFRALAENIELTQTFGARSQFRAPQKLDARRVQPRPGRAGSPIQTIPIFWLNSSDFAIPIATIA
jgi:hypothetical protein